MLVILFDIGCNANLVGKCNVLLFDWLQMAHNETFCKSCWSFQLIIYTGQHTAVNANLVGECNVLLFDWLQMAHNHTFLHTIQYSTVRGTQQSHSANHVGHFN